MLQTPPVPTAAFPSFRKLIRRCSTSHPKHSLFFLENLGAIILSLGCCVELHQHHSVRLSLSWPESTPSFSVMRPLINVHGIKVRWSCHSPDRRICGCAISGKEGRISRRREDLRHSLHLWPSRRGQAGCARGLRHINDYKRLGLMWTTAGRTAAKTECKLGADTGG